MIFTNEKPLDNIVSDGGFCGIFRTIGCIGDSLSSGELEYTKEDGSKGYKDYYEYSWGQYMARTCGNTVYNFSKGGMTARAFHKFAQERGFWNDEYKCQAYVIALGVNDIDHEKSTTPIGDVGDLDREDYDSETNFTFAGEYEKIIRKIREIQPKARIFLMTMPDNRKTAPLHSELLTRMAAAYEFTYVIDLYKYAPTFRGEFSKRYFLGGHMNPMGYMVMSKLVMSYIDYIIRNNYEDFKQVGFIGTEYHNVHEKW